MLRPWRRSLAASFLGAALTLLLNSSMSRGQDPDADLRTLLEKQKQEIQELTRRLDALSQPGIDPAPAKVEIEEGALRKIVADYLRDNPGAGMPSGVQTGWYPGQGFVMRSAPSPKYIDWQDDCKIPFELRFRGRVQLDYYAYKVTDNLNHQTGQRYAPAVGDESELSVKRADFIWFGTAFSPNLRYFLQLEGSTLGFTGGQQNNRIVVGTTPPGGSGQGAPGIGAAGSPIGGGVTVDHAIQLRAGFLAYDFHPTVAPGPEGNPVYVPTFTLIGGKLKPLFCLEEFFGSGNQQFVEYSMANWFFDSDNDALLMGAGFQFKGLDDRLFVQGLVTNGNESGFNNTQMDELPGINIGAWYDFGGSWDPEQRRWDLFGDCLADVDYSPCPVVRVGGAINLVPMDRRSIYGDVEQSRVLVMPAGPGGTALIGMLNGDALAGANQGAHAVDKFNSYSFDAFVATKYRGFSLSNEWWCRNLDSFRTTPNGGGNILYTSNVNAPVAGTAIGTSTTALFPRGGLFDYGMQLQGGYFVVPKKWEVVARWSWINGQSGDINGNGRTLAVVNVPNVGTPGATPVRVIEVADGPGLVHRWQPGSRRFRPDRVACGSRWLPVADPAAAVLLTDRRTAQG